MEVGTSRRLPNGADRNLNNMLQEIKSIQLTTRMSEVSGTRIVDHVNF